jgi:hypothetical protein
MDLEGGMNQPPPTGNIMTDTGLVLKDGNAVAGVVQQHLQQIYFSQLRKPLNPTLDWIL